MVKKNAAVLGGHGFPAKVYMGLKKTRGGQSGWCQPLGILACIHAPLSPRVLPQKSHKRQGQAKRGLPLLGSCCTGRAARLGIVQLIIRLDHFYFFTVVVTDKLGEYANVFLNMREERVGWEGWLGEKSNNRYSHRLSQSSLFLTRIRRLSILQKQSRYHLMLQLTIIFIVA